MYNVGITKLQEKIMKELMDAFHKKFGYDIGVVFYSDLSGHVFRAKWRIDEKTDYETSLFMFQNIEQLTVEEILR